MYKELGDKQKDIVLILLLWTFLPIIVLSFSSIKEVTYILPSYVAIAIMLGGWLDERLNTAESLFKSLVLFALIVLPIVIASFTLAVLSVKIYLITVIVWMILCLILAIISIFKLRVVQATFIVFGMLLCMIIMINTPEVMLTTRLSRKCHIDLAKYVFDRVRDKQLFVYGGCETIRSSMPFYGKRPVPSIGGHAILKKLLSSGENNFVIIIDEHLKKMREDKELSRILDNCKIELLPFPNLSDEYSLISAPGAKR